MSKSLIDLINTASRPGHDGSDAVFFSDDVIQAMKERKWLGPPVLSAEHSTATYDSGTHILTVMCCDSNDEEPAGDNYFPVWWYFQPQTQGAAPCVNQNFSNFPTLGTWLFTSMLKWGANRIKITYPTRGAGLTFQWLDLPGQPSLASAFYEAAASSTVFDAGTGVLTARVVWVAGDSRTFHTDITLAPEA